MLSQYIKYRIYGDDYVLSKKQCHENNTKMYNILIQEANKKLSYHSDIFEAVKDELFLFAKLGNSAIRQQEHFVLTNFLIEAFKKIKKNNDLYDFDILIDMYNITRLTQYQLKQYIFQKKPEMTLQMIQDNPESIADAISTDIFMQILKKALQKIKGKKLLDQKLFTVLAMSWCYGSHLANIGSKEQLFFRRQKRK